jgi:hypothetical protein
MPPQWYVIRRLSGLYWTGHGDECTPDLSQAKLFTELEMEVSFVFKNEEWMPLPTKGDA